MVLSLTLAQFNSLSNDDKYTALEDHGTHLELFRIDRGYQVNLFGLFGYYVEVHYCPATDNLIKAEGFDNYKRLDLYLSEVDILPVYALL